MDENICKMKKIISVLLMALMIITLISPISNAAGKTNIVKGGRYKFKGVFLTVYKTEADAKKGILAKGKSVLWKNAEIKVEEMNNNIIKIGEGKFIKLTLLNKSSFELLEIVPEEIVPQKIEITSKIEKLKGEESVALEYKITPENATNKSVTWKSSDPSVLEVDENGKITAKRTGKAKITVTTKSGSKKASCEIVVYNEFAGFKVAMESSRITEVRGKIEKNKISYENYLETKQVKKEDYETCIREIGLHYIDMLYYNEALNKNISKYSDVKASKINDYSKRVISYKFKDVKAAIDRGELVFIDWFNDDGTYERTVCFGYKDKADSINDFIEFFPEYGKILGYDVENTEKDGEFRFVIVPKVKK